MISEHRSTCGRSGVPFLRKKAPADRGKKVSAGARGNVKSGVQSSVVCGLVQIPCIERNAFAACRALDAQLYASLSDGKHRVSFDKVVDVMKRTGHDIPSLYKETSEGGLAKEF